MIETTELTGFADSNNLKYLLSYILKPDEVLYLTTYFTKNSNSIEEIVHLAFTDFRIIEFTISQADLCSITSYKSDTTPHEVLEILSNIESVSYFNETLKAIRIEENHFNFLTVSFIDAGEVCLYIKQTPYTSTYMRYLQYFADKISGRIE